MPTATQSMVSTLNLMGRNLGYGFVLIEIDNI